MGLREVLEVVDRAALLSARQLCRADHLAQPLVSLRVSGQDEQVPGGRVGAADAGGSGAGSSGGAVSAGRAVSAGAVSAGQVQAELGAEDRADPDSCFLPQPGCGLGELRHPVHAVVVGNGQPGKTAFCCLGDQLAGAGSPVEEAVGRMTMQLGPRRAAVAVVAVLAVLAVVAVG